MLKLAEEYARLKGTSVIAHRVDGDEIVFVLESGPKLRMSELELQKAVEQSAAARAKAAPVPASEVVPKSRSKPKRKERHG